MVRSVPAGSSHFPTVSCKLRAGNGQELIGYFLCNSGRNSAARNPPEFAGIGENCAGIEKSCTGTDLDFNGSSRRNERPGQKRQRLRKKLQTEQKTAQLLLEEGNQRIGNSLRKGNFTDIQAAYALNKIGTEKMKIIDEDMSQIMKDISMIQQKRAHTDREQSNEKRKLAAEQ
ncbi:unnamed protein product, partial [Adineta ricciae]